MIQYPSEAMISKNIDSSTCYIFDNTFFLDLKKKIKRRRKNMFGINKLVKFFLTLIYPFHIYPFHICLGRILSGMYFRKNSS